jgi:hypothetical protein
MSETPRGQFRAMSRHCLLAINDLSRDLWWRVRGIGRAPGIVMTSTFSRETAAREKTKFLAARLATAVVLVLFSVVPVAAQNAEQTPSSPQGAGGKCEAERTGI